MADDPYRALVRDVLEEWQTNRTLQQAITECAEAFVFHRLPNSSRPIPAYRLNACVAYIIEELPSLALGVRHRGTEYTTLLHPVFPASGAKGDHSERLQVRGFFFCNLRASYFFMRLLRLRCAISFTAFASTKRMRGLESVGATLIPSAMWLARTLLLNAVAFAARRASIKVFYITHRLYTHAHRSRRRCYLKNCEQSR